MPWMELRLDTTAEAVDWVCTLLATTAYTHEIQITPYRLEEGVDRSSHPSTPWASTLYLHLPCDGHEHTHLAAISTSLSSLERTGLATPLQQRIVSTPTIATYPMSQRIGQRFVVTSGESTAPPQSDPDILLRLKPSLAFGSGLHPATQLSLQLLERYILPDMNVLDLGSGSGILSIAMAKLGAQVCALDNDRLAVQATQAAVQHNHVAQQVTVLSGSLGQGNHLGNWMGGVADDGVNDHLAPIDLPIPFDLIVANILARIHITLAADFRTALQPATATGGWLITAGFTTDYASDVVAALTAVGFEPIAEIHDHDWVALVHRLKA
jgi:ribosomal protein L11 methyltransferase